MALFFVPLMGCTICKYWCNLQPKPRSWRNYNSLTLHWNVFHFRFAVYDFLNVKERRASSSRRNGSRRRNCKQPLTLRRKWTISACCSRWKGSQRTNSNARRQGLARVAYYFSNYLLLTAPDAGCYLLCNVTYQLGCPNHGRRNGILLF